MTEAAQHAPFQGANMNAQIAGVAALFGIFGFGYNKLVAKRDGNNNTLGEPIIVKSMREWEEIRQARFNDGIKAAFVGAAQWGTLGAIGLFGFRPLEPKVFGTRLLMSAGSPRLVFLVAALASCGFAIKGEVILQEHARHPFKLVEE
eukprot:CAMPEP_0184291100 /NCGR_PEP_ID=MMETSP1049-20130417/3172_1 /TAXON_ID=77928 /ORGANISM="Proteomonas sulcata, Strain CCMP704" /LENGTH=146 /DNA_ID=CAMNT_0026598425 /DNA_START=240 /DNA_END=680 /DNA_ORIENTATION=-